jgi:thermostable 8-oxoguanine DNA glycosylase
MLLSYEIDGFGFALSCDFLKEMGYVKFGKPDTHIKDVFVELGLLGTVPKNSSKADYLSLRIIERIARNNNTTAYAVDKLLWLIGSGNFYLEKLEVASRKDEFIRFMKQRQQAG